MDKTKIIILSLLIIVTIVIAFFIYKLNAQSLDCKKSIDNIEKTRDKQLTDKDKQLTNKNKELTDKNKELTDKEAYYNYVASKNLELTDKVKNDKNFKNYASCINNVGNLSFFKVFKNDDAAYNSTRYYYCSPYYTNGVANDTSQDFRKSYFINKL